jgi:pullulanase/glycogen debranching enzyme
MKYLFILLFFTCGKPKTECENNIKEPNITLTWVDNGKYYIIREQNPQIYNEFFTGYSFVLEPRLKLITDSCYLKKLYFEYLKNAR